ncbi:hypothetical protein B296_00047667 [Ensete ventricosum]|uniref:Uncharacterized protein n=1 Tax=Ensete ventricosum TaxID=4639 RepID=A0A426XDR8_ENSVE|nr:hypothetical protein B296_00047667 [Ensete ventricosum]
MPSFAGGRQVDGEIFPHRQVAPPVVGRRECLSGHSESTGGRNCCARIAVMPPPPTNAVPDTGLRRISSHAIRQWSIDPLLDGLLAELCTSIDISTNCALVVVNEAPSHKPLIFCCSSPLSMYKTFDMRQQSNSCSPANEDGAPHASDSHADSLFLKGPLDGRRKRSNREIILS